MTKQSNRLKLVGVAITGFTVACVLFNSVRAQVNTVSDIVYTESNIPTENGNTILGFRRNQNGRLTPLANSFPTGGKGIVDPQFLLGSLDGDFQIITNPEKTQLFAVNSGSNTIAVFDIAPNGNLTPIEGSPFPSGGTYPVSLALADDLLIVANRNLDAQDLSRDVTTTFPNYTTFRVTENGQLRQRFTFNVPRGGAPEAIVVSPDNKFLFSVEQSSNVIRSFRIRENGRLVEARKSPLLGFSEIANITLGPIGIEVHPDPNQRYVYVGYPTESKLAVHSYDENSGMLTFERVVENSGAAICWITSNKAGTRLYTANTLDNSISVYDNTDPSTPVEIQNIKLNTSIVGATNLTLDTDEEFLHVLTQRLDNNAPVGEGNGIHTLRVNPADGKVSEVRSSPIAIPSVEGSVPQGLLAF